MRKSQPVLVLLFIAITFLITTKINAQSTFASVHQILQNNCSSSGCHNSANAAAGLDFTASLTDVYNALVNQAPQNAAAAAKGNLLVAPGYSVKSFFYRKIATGFDQIVQLDAREGASMTDSLASLTNEELEIVRQWIEHGAPLNDTVVDLQVVHDFHNGHGLPLVNRPPSPVEEGLEGMQLRIGPILMIPGQESEYFHKFVADLATEKEVYRMQTFFDSYSHHFVLYDFLPSEAVDYPEGIQNANSYNAQIPIHLGAKEVGAWNVSRDNPLPPGTAFFWNETTNLVMDYHVRNYSDTMILGAVCYINIYTRPRQQVTSEMHMDFPVYGGFNPFLLEIPPTGQPYKLEFTLTKPNQTWDVWKMQGHTHKLGKDFDIFLRNADGSRGQQVYEGFYNSEYTFNQGYFDNQHAPVRTTEAPFVRVDMDNGLILEATWLNNGPDTMRFGLTTQDEMFAAYITYTNYKNSTDVTELQDAAPEITVQPNPASDFITVQFASKAGVARSLRLYSLEGKLVFQSPEFTAESFTVPVADLPKGVYFVETEVSGNKSTAKIIVE